LAIFHRGRLDGDKFVEAIQRKNKTARMLREMARRPHEPARQRNSHLQAAVIEIKVELFKRR
jgi:hypothetical protein